MKKSKLKTAEVKGAAVEEQRIFHAFSAPKNARTPFFIRGLCSDPF